jgi:hypothetical protein
VLVAMANCVDGKGDEMCCWPSTLHLAEATAQDRKTVLENLRRLRDDGFIVDTGARRGATGQIAVYRLNEPKSGTVAEGGMREMPPAAALPSSTEIGTVEESRKRNGPENGTVPNSPPNSPEFPVKESQISLLTVPRTGHGTTKDPLKIQEGTTKKTRGFDAAEIDLPDWLNPDVWRRWVRDRKQRNKSITEDAARLQLKKLAEYLQAGYTPDVVIDNAIENGWQGLYEPKNKPRSASKHAGFASKNYREGVTEDGSFA